MLPRFLSQDSLMPDARIEKKLYKISFFVLDSQSDFKVLIISDIKVNDTTPTYAQN